MAEDRFRVLIVGGGVAALEAGLALQHLAGERVGITFVAPNPEFVYRPMVVREPFGFATAERYPLGEIVRDLGAELEADRFASVEPDSRRLHTEAGRTLRYDALLLALGARMRPQFAHAITLDDRQLDDQLHGLIQDVEGGYVRSLAFLVPDPTPWPLPVYELALLTAARAQDAGMDLAVTVVTPEDAPLAVFGAAVSQAVARLLTQGGVSTLTSAHAEVSAPGRVAVHPGKCVLEVDRIVALPRLFGPAAPGIPTGAPDGFIPVDAHSRVRGAARIYAAGDATDFPLKHGGIAAQQADAAAQGIAALAGVNVAPRPLAPVIHGMLLGGPRPLYLSAHVTGGHGSTSTISENPPDDHPAKIEARYLAPYLIACEGKLGSRR